ncbi:hypothetical protein HMPREF3033_00589 [Veillonellaceae bacterium DNF00751]|nr:hypothetical protein HMPREF3033_00589 [Veillonellaceae bacterium DNF00751]
MKKAYFFGLNFFQIVAFFLFKFSVKYRQVPAAECRITVKSGDDSQHIRER